MSNLCRMLFIYGLRTGPFLQDPIIYILETSKRTPRVSFKFTYLSNNELLCRNWPYSSWVPEGLSQLNVHDMDVSSGHSRI